MVPVLFLCSPRPCHALSCYSICRIGCVFVQVDPTVFNMLHEESSAIDFSEIGGLTDQIRELREVIELPLTNPELFVRVGIKAPKGVLLYGPPGTGKTLLARALASNINGTFLKVLNHSPLLYACIEIDCALCATICTV